MLRFLRFLGLGLMVLATPAFAVQYVDLAKESTSTVGDGATLTVTGAVSGFLTIEGAGVTGNATEVDYGIIDGSNREAGRGVYNSSTNVLTRCGSGGGSGYACTSTNSGNRISLSGTALVGLSANALAFTERALTATNMIAGAGLTGGGTLAADRTFAVGEGTYLDVNADDVAFDPTEVGSVTWGSGSGTTWIFDAGATDPRMTFASGSLTMGSGAVPIGVVVEGTLDVNGTGLNGHITADGDVTAGGDLFSTDDVSVGDDILLIEGASLNWDGGDCILAQTGNSLDTTGCAISVASLETIDLGTDTAGDYVAGVADGTGIDGTATGEGSTYTPTFDATELTDLTWSAGASDIDWLFSSGASGTTGFRVSDIAARMQFGFGDFGVGVGHPNRVQGSYFQAFGDNWATASQRGGTEFVFSSENSGTGGFTVFEYDGSGWTSRFKVGNSGVVSLPGTIEFNSDTANTFDCASGHCAIEGATVWDSGNDGSGSTLDADLLDGVSSAGFLLDNTDLGDFTCASDVCAIDADSVALTTDTTGDYVAGVADGTGIDGTASGEGSTYTPTFDSTELTNLTWGNGSGYAWTFDAGATDPILTFASDSITISVSGLNVTGATSSSGINIYSLSPSTDWGQVQAAYSNDSAINGLLMEKSRGTSVGAHAALSADDQLGLLQFAGSNSSNGFTTGAAIEVNVDGTPTSGGDLTDMPGRISFFTTPDGSSTTTGRWIIDSSGVLKPFADGTYDIGTTALGVNNLFLDTGAVINFESGDVTITHSADTLTIAGGITAIADLSTIGGQVFNMADNNLDEIMVWDDSAAQVIPMPLATMTTEASPAAGDYVLIYGAEGDLRKANWNTLPGVGGGISNVVEDTTPQLGGFLDWNGQTMSDATLTDTLVLDLGEDELRLTNDTADVDGVQIIAHHDSASPADGDLALDIQVFAGADDEEVGRIALEVDDGSTTSEDTRWRIFNDVAGSSVESLIITGALVTAAGSLTAATDLTATAGDVTSGDDVLVGDDVRLNSDDSVIGLGAAGTEATITHVAASDSLTIAADPANGTASTVINLATDGTTEAILDSTALTPGANDGNALGSDSVRWADGFFADGAVLNLGASGSRATITHTAASDSITIAADPDNATATSQVVMSVDGSNELILDPTNLTPGADGGNSLGTTALGWQNLFRNTGFVDNWENGDCLLTHSSNLLALTGSCALTSDSTLDLSGVTTATLTASGANLLIEGSIAKKVGTQTMWIPAGAMVARATSGATCGSTYDSGSNDVTITVCTFANAADSHAQFTVQMPKGWDEGTFSFEPHWTATAGTATQTVDWELSCVFVRNDDTLNATMGTAQASNDAYIAANDEHIGPAPGTPVTCGGSVTEAATLVVFNVMRDVSDGTLAQTVTLLGIKVTYTDNAANDS